jgi:nitrous oxidase accessory protein NosD
VEILPNPGQQVQFNIRPYVAIEGDPIGNIILTGTPAEKPSVLVAASHVLLRNVHVQGDSAPGHIGFDIQGADFRGLQLRAQAANTGISIQANRAEIDESQVEGNQIGVHLAARSNDALITDLEALNNQIGLQINAQGALITRAVIESQLGQGILINGARNTLINDNQIGANPNDRGSIGLSIDNSGNTDLSDLTIQNYSTNVFVGAGANTTNLQSNVIGPGGIGIDRHGIFTLITGNLITNNGNTGILFRTCHLPVPTQNTFDHNGRENDPAQPQYILELAPNSDCTQLENALRAVDENERPINVFQ